MRKNLILAFVGPSGVGKTTLMIELLKELPELLFPIVTLATRERRGPEDDVFCRFVSSEYIWKKRAKGELAQYLEYAGNVYGCEFADIESALKKGIGIQAYVESSISALRAVGYEVLPIRIFSSSGQLYRDELREKEDREREKVNLDYVFALDNSFEPGGLTQSVKDLKRFILSL